VWLFLLRVRKRGSPLRNRLFFGAFSWVAHLYLIAFCCAWVSRLGSENLTAARRVCPNTYASGQIEKTTCNNATLVLGAPQYALVRRFNMLVTAW